MTNHSHFIATEPFGNTGEAGEQLVWERLQIAFSNRNCLAYWRYPLFSIREKVRQEPDILIVDRQLGLIIIEVKSLHNEQIISIQGHLWQYQNFYTDYGNPYQQAENQLFTLLKYFEREITLKDRVCARAIVALPYITEQQWHKKGFTKLPSNPPILFKNYLQNPQKICQFFAEIPSLTKGNQLTLTQWQLLTAILTGSPVLVPASRSFLVAPQSRGDVLKNLRSRLAQFDLQQEKIAKQIPPGLQVIRGIAGSGKTIILCQKAALMHLKYPDWQIAVVFFSRSLYSVIIEKISQWINYYTNGQQIYNPQNSNLKVLHAWGGKHQPGFYSTICKLVGKTSLAVNFTESIQPNEALGEVCYQLLQSTAIPQVFDAILIDEGQDLVVNQWKYQNKQPFYWLAYQSLRSLNSIHPEQKRLIWAYDEFQSLASLKMPTASELFGEELGHLTIGSHPNQINKTEIIANCYRTPHLILTAAHALGMGLLRSQGILTGFTTKAEWQAIAYQVEGTLANGEQVTIKRSVKNSLNPISQLWHGAIIEFITYTSRQQELTALVEKIKYNFRKDGLRPAREILIIALGNYWQASELVTHTVKFLNRQGIYTFVPQKNKFWDEGAVTVTTIYLAKGQEADLVYLIGLDYIAQNESNVYLRNQLLVALTRTRAWVHLSGIKPELSYYSFYQEIEQVIKSKDSFTFTFTYPLKRTINASNLSNLITGYALGQRNFRKINLQQADLSKLNLANINLIEANLQGANLTDTCLSGAKLIAANLSYTDLTAADLSNAKLMGANLQNTNLTNTNFTGADLTNTKL